MYKRQDDESLVRLGIKSSVAWEEYGYEIVGEADNGQTGLEMIREKHPDIVPVSYTHLDVYKRQPSTPFKDKFICAKKVDSIDIQNCHSMLKKILMEKEVIPKILALKCINKLQPFSLAYGIYH